MSSDSQSFAARLHQVFDLDEVEAHGRPERLASAAEVTKIGQNGFRASCNPTDPPRLRGADSLNLFKGLDRV